ncbi:hypothetical protein [Mycobacterium sp. URHB0021]|jgi:hypothetical protein
MLAVGTDHHVELTRHTTVAHRTEQDAHQVRPHDLDFAVAAALVRGRSAPS